MSNVLVMKMGLALTMIHDRTNKKPMVMARR